MVAPKIPDRVWEFLFKQNDDRVAADKELRTELVERFERFHNENKEAIKDLEARMTHQSTLLKQELFDRTAMLHNDQDAHALKDDERFKEFNDLLTVSRIEKAKIIGGIVVLVFLLQLGAQFASSYSKDRGKLR